MLQQLRRPAFTSLISRSLSHADLLAALYLERKRTMVRSVYRPLLHSMRFALLLALPISCLHAAQQS